MSDPSFQSSIDVEGERITFSVFRSRKRTRTVAFRFEGDTLRVLAPVSATLRSIEKILHKRVDWIARERAAQKKENGKAPFTDGAVFRYLGHPCLLKITHGDEAPRACLLSPRMLRVHLPETNLSPQNLREEVRLEILLWIKRRAREKFKRRLDLWAKKMGVKYQRLLISNADFRWGSCSHDNVIRLNWRLMMAPLAILDYVVAHELCHVRHKNHSARYWNFLSQSMPDCAMRRKALRKIERKLAI